MDVSTLEVHRHIIKQHLYTINFELLKQPSRLQKLLRDKTELLFLLRNIEESIREEKLHRFTRNSYLKK
jgi:hypothetical protein